MTSSASKRDNSRHTSRRGTPKRHQYERNQRTFLGNPPGPFSFFTSFPTILCRLDGSVLPNVLVETSLCGMMSILACMVNLRWRDEPVHLNTQGHAIAGVMLSFLVVFRSQIAWNMFVEGRGHLGTIISGVRAIALETVSCLSASQSTIHEQMDPLFTNAETLSHMTVASESSQGTSKAKVAPSYDLSAEILQRDEQKMVLLAAELLRLLKLFYFVAVEHLRSSEGYEVWEQAQQRASDFATSSELEEFLEEFGPAQIGLRQRVARTYHFDEFAGKTDVELAVTQDPTRTKPLLVLVWIRMALERAMMAGWCALLASLRCPACFTTAQSLSRRPRA